MRVIFSDVDGTLIEDTKYNTLPLKIREEVVDLIKKYIAHSQDCHLILVSNQSGIGRGICTQLDYLRVYYKLKLELKKRGLEVLDMFYCPHSPVDKCLCRKPGTELFKTAAGIYEFDLSDCTFVGNSAADKTAAKELNMQFMKV